MEWIIPAAIGAVIVALAVMFIALIAAFTITIWKELSRD